MPERNERRRLGAAAHRGKIRSKKTRHASVAACTSCPTLPEAVAPSSQSAPPITEAGLPAVPPEMRWLVDFAEKVTLGSVLAALAFQLDETVSEEVDRVACLRGLDGMTKQLDLGFAPPASAVFKGAGRIAQRYQEWLAEEGRSDRIDLCRRALFETRAESRQRKIRRYDVVVCDGLDLDPATPARWRPRSSPARRRPPGLPGVPRRRLPGGGSRAAAGNIAKIQHPAAGAPGRHTVHPPAG